MPLLNVNLPNVITLGRVVAVPVIFWLLIGGDAKSAFILFVVAGVSDAADGFLAKRYRWQTELGAHLDPLADKLLIVSIYVALGARGQLPLWLVVVVVCRDVAILAAVMVAWLIHRPVVIRPLLVSKLNTVAQLVLASVVLADEGFGLNLSWLREGLTAVTGVLTVVSLAAYLQAWHGHLADRRPGEHPEW